MTRRALVRVTAVLIVLAVMWTGAEAVSWVFLKTIAAPDASATLIADSFPASLRLDRNLRIDAARGQALRVRSPLAMDVFDFDPALAFRHIEYLRWYTAERASEPASAASWSAWWDRFAEEAHGRVVILCFGGSTTASAQPANWPRHIADLLALRGVDRPALVLNAGHNGFTTMQQQLWASYWILPELDKRGVVVSVALSLDGVNDISYGLGGWQAYRNLGNAPWLKSYNGFYQVIDAQTKSLNRPGPAFVTFWRAVLSSHTVDVVLNQAASLLPTTVALARSLGRPSPYQPIVQMLLSYRMHNIFRVRDLIVAVPWSSGPLDAAAEAPYFPQAKIAHSMRQVIRFVEGGDGGARADDVDLRALRAADVRPWDALPMLDIPEQPASEILDAYRSNLLAFQTVFTGRGIPVINTLQPIADPDRNPYVAIAGGKDIPNFDFVLAHWAMSGMQPGALVKVAARAEYRKAEDLYSRLAAVYKGRFLIATRVFADANEDYFTADNIHYTPRGSVRIASIIADACLQASYCGKASSDSIGDHDVASLADRTRLDDDSHPHLIGTRGPYNLVRYGGRYLAVPQSAGAVDWDSATLSQMTGLLAAYSQAALERALERISPGEPTLPPGEDHQPHLLGSIATYNLVRFEGRLYGVPQALGSMKWGEIDIATLPDVVVAGSESELRELLLRRGVR